ncbi:MAG TPA: 3-isopropylmalate dehydratase small subunit [Planctomycetota bacterium]|nr:3-isopropylmalate dehydratase small subunit [Planctomycetota bacterium]
MSAISEISTISGRAVPVRGDDIDTDRIIPARFLRCVTFEGLGEHAFADDRKSTTGGPHPFDRPEFQGASVLVVNANFGCGSSREHAPQSLLRWGIRGIVGESFAEIFFGNCVALGVPCITLERSQVEALQKAIEADPAVEVTLDLESRTVRRGDVSYAGAIPDGARRAFLTGTWDSTALLLAAPEEIDAVAQGLPYVAHWK